MKAKFSHASLTISEVYNMYKKNEIRIPSYQRSIKWNDEKRQLLISTIKEGNPMGAILVYKDAEGYRIIDGLQRISTIVDYNNKVHKYINKDTIKKEHLDSFYEMYQRNVSKAIPRDDIADEFINIINKLKKEDEQLEGSRLYSQIFKNLKFNNNDIYFEINPVIEDICTDLLKSEISNYPIFLIKYEGSDDELPDIFHALNTGAVNLTKYEVISSTWNDKRIAISDTDLLDKLKIEIKNKYDKMEIDGFVFDFEGKSDIEQNEKTLNLFEMCESLGSLLGKRDENNILFSQRQSSELGFEIISLILHGKKFTNDIGEEKIFEYSKPSNIMYFLNDNTDAEEVSKLLNAIFQTKEEINTMLKPFIYYKQDTNTLLQKYMSKHIFKSMFEKKYQIEYINGNLTVHITNTDLSKYKNNIIASILYDEITSFWQKNRQLGDFIRMIEKNTDKYDSMITRSRFTEAFKSYLKEIMTEDKLTYDRSTFNNTTKLLSYALHKALYISNIEYQHYYEGVDASELEFDHKYPKVKLQNSGTYVSSILNCWVITKGANRSKGSKNTNAVKNENYVSNIAFDDMIGRLPVESGFNDYSVKERVNLFEENSEKYAKSLLINIENLHNILCK